jgi:hypothetical protein
MASIENVSALTIGIVLGALSSIALRLKSLVICLMDIL